MFALLLSVTVSACQQQSSPPQPERDLTLELVARTPARTHAWWPSVVEVWAVNHSDHAVPIVRAMGESWDDLVEPFLAWRGTLTNSDGTSSVLPTGAAHAGCGLHSTSWVQNILSVPPGGREKLFVGGLNGLFAREQSGTIDVQLEYTYRGRPSLPSPPTDELQRFGALAGVAPFRLQSNELRVELLPPAISGSELVRDFSIEVELENEGRFAEFGIPHGRALLRNVSNRTHRIVHPTAAGIVGLARPDGWPSTRRFGPDFREQPLDLGPGARVEIEFDELLCLHPWWMGPTHDLQLAYVWSGLPADQALFERDPRAAYGHMADVPPFVVRSSTFRIEITKPLVLEIVPRAPLPKAGSYALSDVLGLRLRNVGEVSISLSDAKAPLEATVHTPDGWLHFLDFSGEFALPAHAEIDLFRLDANVRSVETGVPPRANELAGASIKRAVWTRPVGALQVALERR